MPVSVTLRYNDGVYATDSDNSAFGAGIKGSNILATMVGYSLPCILDFLSDIVM